MEEEPLASLLMDSHFKYCQLSAKRRLFESTTSSKALLKTVQALMSFAVFQIILQVNGLKDMVIVAIVAMITMVRLSFGLVKYAERVILRPAFS